MNLFSFLVTVSSLFRDVLTRSVSQAEGSRLTETNDDNIQLSTDPEHH